MKAASLKSPRLQRVLKLLADGKRHSTREIVRKCNVMAVSAIVSELRANGAVIHCTREHQFNQVVWQYQMTKGPSS